MSHIPGKLRVKMAGLLGSSLVYAFAQGIEGFVPLLLLPLLTRFLTPTEYGIWVLFVSAFSFMRPLIGLTLQDAVRMRFHELDAHTLSKFVVTSLVISTVLLALTLTVGSIFSPQLAAFAKFPEQWLWSIAVAAYLHGFFYTCLALLQFRGERKRFAAAQLLQTALTLVFSVALVLTGWAWQGVIMARISGLLIAVCIIAKYMLRDISFEIAPNVSRAYTKELLWFGLRYLPAGLSVVIIPLTHRLLIAHMVSVEEASLFAIGAQFGMALLVIVAGFIFAWQPWLFKRLATRGAQDRKEITRVSLIFYISLPLLALAISGVATLLAPLLIGERFLLSTSYIFWMTIAAVFEGYYRHNQAFIHFTKRVELMSIASLIALALNAILGYMLIGRYGGIGAAWATALAYAVAALVSATGSWYLLGSRGSSRAGV